MLHGAVWNRIRSLRVNASRRSNAELDESTDLDAGDPGERGDQHALLREHLAKLTVVGGRCGTDHRQGGSDARLVAGRQCTMNGSQPHAAVQLDDAS